MLQRLAPILALLALFPSAQAKIAPDCSAKKIKEILAPADKSKQVYINCSATLPPNSTIKKELIFQGVNASGSIFDCNGAKIVRQGSNGDNVKITSIQKNGEWQRPENIMLKNCNIEGALRISGMDDNSLRTASQKPDATDAIQAAAPSRITLDQINITGSGRIPLYLRPGTTFVTIRNSRISGQSDGTAVYFDMESANNIFQNNTIEVKSKREQLALDGSARNNIINNRFLSPAKGGIFLYRNCGERGVIRHQTPSDNMISSNYFANQNAQTYQPIIWVSSRNGGKSYCEDDAGYPFGSSADNRDFAQNNQITYNGFDQLHPRLTIRQDSKPNRIDSNYSI